MPFGHPRRRRSNVSGSADKLLRKFLWFGIGFILLTPVWFYGWMIALVRLPREMVAIMPDDVQAYIGLIPAAIFLLIGSALLGLRFAIWLQEIAGVPKWWEDE